MHNRSCADFVVGNVFAKWTNLQQCLCNCNTSSFLILTTSKGIFAAQIFIMYENVFDNNEIVTSHDLYTPCYKLSHFIRSLPCWSMTYFMDGPLYKYFYPCMGSGSSVTNEERIISFTLFNWNSRHSTIIVSIPKSASVQHIRTAFVELDRSNDVILDNLAANDAAFIIRVNIASYSMLMV